MKVILNSDIKGVGKAGDIINASDGYSRNYLLPKKLAVEANKKNLLKLKEKKDSENIKKDKIKNQAIENLKKIQDITIQIKVKAGENGKIFGGVTAKEISENLLNNYGIEIDKKKIYLNEAIKNLGSFLVDIKLHEGISGKLKVNVVKE